jgi:acyl carrier protein
VITQEAFIRVVRDELRLPLADPALETNFDQTVNWRSMQVVRLFVAMERATGQRVPIEKLLAERTVAGVFSLYAGADLEREGV